MIVALIVLLATVENMAPLIVGFLKTPPGYVFLGTVHHPADYFYYLSQFAQGAYRTITTVDLYTTEQIGSSFIGWSNVLLGKAFYIFGIQPLFAYHLSVFAFSILLLIACHKLSRAVLTRSSASLAIYLFALFHAFPIVRDGRSSYGDYWNNFAVPLVRMGSVPHQLLLAIASLVIVYISYQWMGSTTNHRKFQLSGMIFFSFILASLQPALWMLILTSLGITAIVYVLLYGHKIKLLNNFMIPILYISVGGLLPALYLSQRFLAAPFLQLKLWEATQQTQLTWYHFLSATGPIFIMALVSMPWFLKDRHPGKLLLMVFTCLSYALFLSPIPQAFGLSHVRFMSTLTILCVSIIAADGLRHFETTGILVRHGKFFRNIVTALTQRSPWRAKAPDFDDANQKASRDKPPIFTTITLALLTLYLIPNHFLTIRLSSNFQTNNAYQYLPVGDYNFLQKVAALTTPMDTFLVIWPYNVVFPGLTGRKTYTGHPLLTIDAGQKEGAANRFFDNTLTTTETHDLLANHHITHVIAYSWTAFPSGLYDILATDGSLALYRVNQGYLKSYSK